MDLPSSPQPSRMDGRWVIVGCVLAYFALIFAAQQVMDYHRFWRWLGVPSTVPAFADMTGLTQAVENARDGFDPILGNPANPARSTANYPHLWFWPLVALQVDERHAVALGSALALTFYACVLLFVGRIAVWEGVVWSTLLCAPPAMLGVERGNNDLVIFNLLALALLARRSVARRAARGGSYVLIEACAWLKLYPFGAFCLALREKPRPAAAILTAAGLIFAGYLYVIRDQLKSIRAIMPQSYAYSYGSHVLADRLGAGHPGLVPGYAPALAIAGVLVLAGVVWWQAPRLPPTPPSKVDGLMVGSFLYASSFVLSSNFNYRLIFLLFAVPALLHWHREEGFYRQLAVGLLVVLVPSWAFSCWAFPGRLEAPLFLLKEVGNWAVFAGMIFLWLKCLPDWSDRSAPDRLVS